MKVAIIGAGLSGLATAWKLIETKRCQVTLFDQKGVGGGASGVASGLMHPYVGEQARRSECATESLHASRDLLSHVESFLGYSVARYEGIVRIAQNPEQREALEGHVRDYGDVEALGQGAFLIRSGVTVHCQPYLEGLWQMISSRGGKLEQVKIESLGTLSDFDAIVIAAGYGVAQFSECAELKLKYTKGQVLTALAPKGFVSVERSLIGKGYIAVGEAPRIYHLGSTYEKGFASSEPCLETAQQLILPKIAGFFPEVRQFQVTGCRAGVRVIRPDHYFPIVKQLTDTCWVFTALGSRGLLFHALLAERLKDLLLKNS
jgi:glycine/D-amino acid oxidase-like deaminating enzyme